MSELRSLAATVAALLKEAGDTIAVSESSCGGLISACLVSIPGASAYYVGSATGFAFQAHNVPAGMHDYKLNGPDPALRDTIQMFTALAALLPTLQFDPERALEEVNAEYSTTTELADVLQREADVPFRAGHHFASDLVTYGRAHRLRPADLPYTEARRLYTDTATHFGLPRGWCSRCGLIRSYSMILKLWKRAITTSGTPPHRRH